MSPAYTTINREHVEIYIGSGTIRQMSDWCKVEGRVTRLRHLPTDAVFEIFEVPGFDSVEPVRIEHYWARLDYVEGDGSWPVGPVLAVLKREAVLMALYFAGLVVRERKAPTPISDDDVPF